MVAGPVGVRETSLEGDEARLWSAAVLALHASAAEDVATWKQIRSPVSLILVKPKV